MQLNLIKNMREKIEKLLFKISFFFCKACIFSFNPNRISIFRDHVESSFLLCMYLYFIIYVRKHSEVYIEHFVSHDLINVDNFLLFACFYKLNDFRTCFFIIKFKY